MPDSITISRCQPFIGAEIGGVDLTRPLSPEVARRIRSALLTYQVIVLRDQDISRDQHRDFAKIFSNRSSDFFIAQEVVSNPVEGYPEILRLSSRGRGSYSADIWHSDECFRAVPSAVSVLRSRVVPQLGGDTVFSSAVAAYRRLPDEIKAQIRHLRALTGPEFLYAQKAVSLAFIGDYIKRHPARPQPVVRIHPETGEPVLFVNQGYTGKILGVAKDEGERLLRYLLQHVTKPDFQMRVRWTPNTVVVWDNRSVQHYAVADYDEPRDMERIVVAGDGPAFGFDEADTRL